MSIDSLFTRHYKISDNHKPPHHAISTLCLTQKLRKSGKKGIIDFKGKYSEYLEKHQNDYLNREWIMKK